MALPVSIEAEGVIFLGGKMAATAKKKAKKEKKQYFNDLLLPIIFTLCVLPFTVRLKEYDYGYGGYAWHSEYSVLQDLYTYYRMWFFLIIVAIAAIVLVFRMALYKEKNKSARAFIPFAVYLGFVALSCISSANPKAAWLGNIPAMEGFLVLAGYGIIAFYTYQIMETERDYATVYKGMEISFVLMSIIGWMQVFMKDPLLFPVIQKLIMSEEYYEYYEGQMYNIFTGNNVSLSLYNPNYAVIYLIMFACVFAAGAFCSKEKKQKIISVVLLIDALILTWFTYSRAGLVALLVVGVMCIVVYFKETGVKKLRYALYLAGGLLALAGAFVAVDMAVFDGHYVHRMIDAKKDDQLKDILTTGQGVQIDYGDENFLLSLTDEETGTVLRVTDAAGTECAALTEADEEYRLPIATECEVSVAQWNDRPCIFLYMYDNLLTFAKEGDAYVYVTAWGKEDQMVAVEHVDAGGLENLGSGRIYIWTRILPILKHYLLLGSGPDTFAEVFPQNDYAGKLVYAENPARIMERAHNDYLMKWVQTGLLSVVSLIVFYIFILKKGGISFKRKCFEHSSKNIMAFGCLLGCVAYMVCGMFSDSTLYTSPVFYVFAGIVLSASDK